MPTVAHQRQGAAATVLRRTGAWASPSLNPLQRNSRPMGAEEQERTHTWKASQACWGDVSLPIPSPFSLQK